MRILVTNSVPLNGGDEALLRGLIGTLGRHLPAARFTVLTSATRAARLALPDIRFDDDLGFATPERTRGALSWLAGSGVSVPRRRFANVTRRGLECLTGRAGRRRIVELYESCDAVFPAPGGYLHDHYQVAERLDGLEFALGLGKPVFLVGHSIGPFWLEHSMRRVRAVLGRVRRIVVRERYSLEHLRSCGVRTDHVSLAADVAFALEAPSAALNRSSSGNPRRLGLCFRRWPLRDPVSASQTREKAASLCRLLLDDPDVQLVFISTCQGIPGYVDDSRMAVDIVAALPGPLAARCTIDRAHRSPTDLIRVMGTLNAVVSMRMHGCILAMLAGTPAMAFDYELKSAGLYEMMGLDDYHVDFRLGFDHWRAAVDRFLADVEQISAGLRGRVELMAASARSAIADVAAALESGSP